MTIQHIEDNKWRHRAERVKFIAYVAVVNSAMENVQRQFEQVGGKWPTFADAMGKAVAQWLRQPEQDYAILYAAIAETREDRWDELDGPDRHKQAAMNVIDRLGGVLTMLAQVVALNLLTR